MASQQISDLQAQLLELQRELPADGSLQMELQRLQSQLAELSRQPVRLQPRDLIVQPSPAPVQLEGAEVTVVATFTRMLRALSPVVPLTQLFTCAASLTLAAVEHERA